MKNPKKIEKSDNVAEKSKDVRAQVGNLMKNNSFDLSIILHYNIFFIAY